MITGWAKRLSAFRCEQHPAAIDVEFGMAVQQAFARLREANAAASRYTDIQRRIKFILDAEGHDVECLSVFNDAQQLVIALDEPKEVMHATGFSAASLKTSTMVRCRDAHEVVLNVAD